MSTAPLQFLLMTFAGWVNRRQLAMIDYLKAENLVLRQQLIDGKLRFTDDQRRRLAEGRVLGHRLLNEVAGLVKPETILRWYRELIAAKYDGSARRGAGRPGTAATLRELIVRMATENPTWGYTRIRDALGHLGSRTRDEKMRVVAVAEVQKDLARGARRIGEGYVPKSMLRVQNHRPRTRSCSESPLAK